AGRRWRATASICAVTTPGGRWCKRATLPVSCAVTVVVAEHPHTPSAAKTFKSIWRPAAPLLSEPAMVRAVGWLSELPRAGEGAWAAAGSRSPAMEPFRLEKVGQVGERRQHVVRLLRIGKMWQILLP